LTPILASSKIPGGTNLFQKQNRKKTLFSCLAHHPLFGRWNILPPEIYVTRECAGARHRPVPVTTYERRATYSSGELATTSSAELTVGQPELWLQLRGPAQHHVVQLGRFGDIPLIKKKDEDDRLRGMPREADFGPLLLFGYKEPEQQ